MGKEVRMWEQGDGEDAVGDEDGVSEWEIGLPSGDELTPLSQSLVPSVLALAFSIVPERSRTMQDVTRASRNTLSALRVSSNGSSVGANASSSNTAVAAEEEVEVEGRVGSSSPGTDPKKQKKSDGGEAVECSMAEEGGSEDEEDPSGKTLKRPRLVWTPQLHKRFVDVVAHLGVKNAVPKTIMQLMNVEGLTRENVASHLQKYRLYLKRVQGLTTEGSSSSDQLFSSTPVPPQRFQDGGSGNARAAGKLGMPSPAVMPMPVYGHQVGVQGYHQDNPYRHYHHHDSGVFEPNPYMMQQNRFGNMANSPVGGRGVNDK